MKLMVVMAIVMYAQVYLYEFAVKGNLLSNWLKWRNKCILRCLWCLSGVNVSVFIFFNTYWTFVKRDMYTLQIFNFVNRLSDIAFMSANAFLYLLAYVYITKTLNFSQNANDRLKKLRRAQCLVLFNGICYILVVGTLFWGLYTQGFKDP